MPTPEPTLTTAPTACAYQVWSVRVQPTSLDPIELRVQCGQVLVGNVLQPGLIVQARHYGNADHPDSAIVRADSLPDLQVVPEPPAVASILLGFVAIAFLARKRKKAPRC